MWRKVQSSKGEGYSVLLSAIIFLLLFIVDIMFFIVACCVQYVPLIFIFGVIAIIFIAGLVQGIRGIKAGATKMLNKSDSAINQTSTAITEEEQFIKSNKEKILKFSDELYFLIKKYALNRYSVKWKPREYRLWWDEYEGSGNEFYLLLTGDILVKQLIARVGLNPPQRYKKGRGYYVERSYPAREQSFDLLVKMIKNKISESCEWDDESTINSFIYMVIRNGIIRYFHEIYLSDFAQPSIFDLCLKHIDDDHDLYFVRFLYFCHDLFSNNIFAPLQTRRDEIYKEFETIYEKQKFKMYEEESKRPEEKQSLDENIVGFSVNNEAEIMVQTDEESAFKPIIEKIDLMTGRQFEEYIAEFFKKKGYITTLTPESGDFGIDVIIENEYIKIGVQTKCYVDKVSNSAVQEAVTGIRHYNLDKVMVVTNSYFQPSAITLAKDNNVILWDRDKLVKELDIMEE